MFGWRSGCGWRSPTTTPRRPAIEDPDSAEAAMFATYRWLSAVQDSLVTALLD